MIAVSCPRCAESIRVPSASLPDDAYAQCPLCRETFAINELNDRLPPVVQIFSADGQPVELAESSPAMALGHAGDAGGGFGTAALATGAAALGATTFGLSGGAGLDDGDELDEIEGYSDEDDDQQDILVDDTDDDIESEVEDYLDDAAAVELETADEQPVTDSTLLMDTMQMESAEVDVDGEVDEFTADDSGDELVDDNDGTIHFQPDGLDHDGDLIVEEVDLSGEVDEEVESAGASMLPPVAAQTVRSRRAPRRKKGSPIKMIAGVLLGPLLALPLAGGILLAIGKAPDLGFWPFLGGDGTANPRVAATPAGDRQPSPMKDQSTDFNKNGSLVPANSELGAFVRDNVNQKKDTAGHDTAGDDTGSFGATELEALTVDGSADGNSGSDPSALTLPPAVSGKAENDSATAATLTSPSKEDRRAEKELAERAQAEMERAEKERLETNRVEEQRALELQVAERKRSSADAIDTILETPVQIAEGNDSPATIVMSPVIELPEPDAKLSDQPEMLRDVKSTEPTDTPFGEGISLGGPASFDDPEVEERAQAATDSMVELAMKRADGSASDKDLARTYRELCRFAELSPEVTSAATNKLMRQVSESSFVDDFEDKIIVQWMEYTKRPTDGVLLVGILEGTAENTQLKLSSGESISVSLSNGKPLQAVGKRIVAIGNIVAENTVEVSSIFGVQHR